LLAIAHALPDSARPDRPDRPEVGSEASSGLTTTARRDGLFAGDMKRIDNATAATAIRAESGVDHDFDGTEAPWRFAAVTPRRLAAVALSWLVVVVLSSLVVVVLSWLAAVAPRRFVVVAPSRLAAVVPRLARPSGMPRRCLCWPAS